MPASAGGVEVAAASDLGAVVMRYGEPTAVRDVLVHLVEEHARRSDHAGRERVDGRTGY